MKVPFLNLEWQYRQIEKALAPRLSTILNTTAYIGGSDVSVFEKNYASYLNATSFIGVGNGTDALILSLKALGIKPGDEVVTIPTTFFATVSSIIHAGGTPVFVDIDPVTRNFNFELLKKAITPKTKVIIPVHLYGQPADMDRVMALATENNLLVLEDACQAHGALYKGKKVGTLGALGCFSFYPGKNLGAFGDAGGIAVSNVNLENTLKELRNHGGIKKYQHNVVGYNSRLDTLQAAVLDEKLKFLDAWNVMRIDIAEKYNQAFKSVPQIEIFGGLPDTVSVYHLYIIKLKNKDREQFMKYMIDKEIGVGIHYPDPLHLLPALQFLGYKKGDFPISEEYSQSIVSLPIFPGMSTDEVQYVINAVKEYYG
jgi:dTDP-4-amino-4,6-dideoxygalactose transaminase